MVSINLKPFFPFRSFGSTAKWAIGLLITVVVTLIAPWPPIVYAPGGTAPPMKGCEFRVLSQNNADSAAPPAKTPTPAFASPPQSRKRSKRSARPTVATAIVAKNVNSPPDSSPARFTRRYQCTAQDVAIRRCDSGIPVAKKIG